MRHFLWRSEPSDDEICEALLELVRAVKEAHGAPVTREDPSGIFAPHYDDVMEAHHGR